MTTDKGWAAFADIENAEERQQAIHQHLTQIVALPPSERDAAVQALLRAEDGRSAIAHQALVLGRFRAWLTMPPDAVTALARSILTGRGAIGGPAAMASVTADQRAGRELTSDEVTGLVALLPALREHLPDTAGVPANGTRATAVRQSL